MTIYRPYSSVELNIIQSIEVSAETWTVTAKKGKMIEILRNREIERDIQRRVSHMIGEN